MKDFKSKKDFKGFISQKRNLIYGLINVLIIIGISEIFSPSKTYSGTILGILLALGAGVIILRITYKYTPRDSDY